MHQAGFEPAADGLKVRYATSASLALAVYFKKHFSFFIFIVYILYQKFY